MFELLTWVTHNSLALLLGVIGIGLLIGIHELGHFLMCKAFSIATPSFSIGFGPTILAQTFGATEFTLRAIPLGGYVEIAGLAEPGQGEQGQAQRKDQHAFTTKPFYQKLFVLLGGIIFNLLFSFVIFASILYVGAPKTQLLFPYNTTTTIQSIQEEHVDQTQLQSDDVITHIENTAVNNGRDIYRTVLHEHTGAENLTVTYQRDTATHTEKVKPSFFTTGAITLQLKQLQAQSIVHAVQLAGSITWNILKQVYMALYRLVTQTRKAGVGGPLMIIAASMQGAQNGIAIFLLFLGFLSVNLAALNVLPIPVLDGGHIAFLTIEKIVGTPIPERIRGYIDYIFALLLIGFILITSFFDAWKLFSL